MPSENETIDQSSDTQQDANTDAQMPELEPDAAQETNDVIEADSESDETAVVDTLVETDLETSAEEVVEAEPDWDAWLEADPTVEDIVPDPAPVEEPETDAVDDEPVLEEAPKDESSEAELVEPDASQLDAVEEVGSMEIAAEIETAIVVDAAPEQPEKPPVAAPPPPPDKPKKQMKTNRHGLTVKDVVRYFEPCGRCGYFLTGYRAAYGQDNFETAVAEEIGGWISLSWGIDMRELILRSYGSRVETRDLHFEGCCSECRRVFTYQNSRSDEIPSVVRIEVKPRTSQ